MQPTHTIEEVYDLSLTAMNLCTVKLEARISGKRADIYLLLDTIGYMELVLPKYKRVSAEPGWWVCARG